MGLALAMAALRCGQPELVDIRQLSDEDMLATCSMVGAPAAPGLRLDPEDFIRSVVLLRKTIDCPLAGLISNENGAVATVNGWLQAAALGLPVLDAPSNGRAHPTGLMGAMGLNTLAGYTSVQAACGGQRPHNYIELVVRGPLGETSDLIRSASVSAQGMVAVCRNPVKSCYVRDHGAPGAISDAIQVGVVVMGYHGSANSGAAEAIAAKAGGYVLAQGVVKTKRLRTGGGFDSGLMTVSSGRDAYRIPIWNEYLAVEHNGSLLARFPDLVTLLDMATNTPVTSAAVSLGQKVSILVTPAAQLRLGAGMFIPETENQITQVLARELAD